MNESEIWIDVNGYEDLYQVSNYGRIKSLYFGKEKILKPFNIKGYLCVYLYSKNHIKKKWYIHRLVATHFLSNPYNLPEVNHKDENKENNYVDNLEWCDKLYNSNYGNRNYLISLNSVQKTKVNQYSLDGKFIKSFNSIKDACVELGLRSSCISNCCANRYSSSGGYIWKYASMEEEFNDCN